MDVLRKQLQREDFISDACLTQYHAILDDLREVAPGFESYRIQPAELPLVLDTAYSQRTILTVRLEEARYRLRKLLSGKTA